MGMVKWRYFDFQQNMRFKDSVIKDHINEKIFIANQNALLPCLETKAIPKFLCQQIYYAK